MQIELILRVVLANRSQLQKTVRWFMPVGKTRIIIKKDTDFMCEWIMEMVLKRHTPIYPV